MAKFGTLFINYGNYKGEQLVSSKWVKAATSEQFKFPEEIDGFSGYGYFFWISKVNNHSVFVARGKGGQIILCVPDKKLVIVSFGSQWDSKGGNEIEQLVYSLADELTK